MDFNPLVRNWSSFHSYILLGILVILCLIPFSDKAFHIDDPLFVWAGKQVSHQPLDPYNFKLVWYTTKMSMSDVTKNPPLAAYFIALIGSMAGWSERSLHLAFILPALGVVLGSYALARRFCRTPLLAAAVTLLSPGFLVSSCNVMCDTMMLAFWIFAALLWIKGLDSAKPMLLFASGLLVAACALTKYFGISLIPLLLIYALLRQRRFGSWAWYLLTPTLILAGYQFWTQALYGRGLLLDAAEYARSLPGTQEISTLAKGLVGLAFVGGCALPGLTIAPLLWSRKVAISGIILGALGAMVVSIGGMNSGAPIPLEQKGLVTLHLTLFIAGGCCILALAVAELWKSRESETVFLVLWVFGTLFFAGFLNWTINARSVLPLIPAAGILLARRLEAGSPPSQRLLAVKLAVPLIAAAFVSLWAAWADADLANSARRAASMIMTKAQKETKAVWFQGHWGFQYYMEAQGARPVDVRESQPSAGDLMVIPENNTNIIPVEPKLVTSREVIEVPSNLWLTTMRAERGAGFYAHLWGPLPFSFGPVPPERFHVLRLAPLTSPTKGGS